MKLKFLIFVLTLVCNQSFSQGLVRLINPGDTIKEMINYNNVAQKLAEKGTISTDSAIVFAAMLFDGKPYVAGTLDTDSINENLVVSFSKFDCLTFAETVCALVLDARSNNPSYAGFKQNLEKIRYRNGIRNGYVSRLHYVSDWIYDNCQMRIFTDLTPKLGGVLQTETINFMSSNPNYYKPLRSNADNLAAIKAIEDSINARGKRYYIPKNNIKNVEKNIPAGSIIFISTTKKGLDYVHTGIAVKPNGNDGELYMIHASSNAKKVLQTPIPLKNYIESIKNFSGITVLKLNEQ